MTIFISFILLYQFEWSWYWYPIAVCIWGVHEFQLLKLILDKRQARVH